MGMVVDGNGRAADALQPQTDRQRPRSAFYPELGVGAWMRWDARKSALRANANLNPPANGLAHTTAYLDQPGHADGPRDRPRDRQHHLHLNPRGKTAARSAGESA